jgi:hypothetical protein
VKNWRRMPPPTRMSDRIARIGPASVMSVMHP